jgi:hypothetical protein
MADIKKPKKNKNNGTHNKNWSSLQSGSSGHRYRSTKNRIIETIENTDYLSSFHRQVAQISETSF